VKALVVTSVHQSGDPRVRERTVRSLAEVFEVRYATRPPGPAAGGDHEWVRLAGGRLRRDWGAFVQMMQGDVAVVSVHDPELIPAALAARLLRRVPVVVDVHEDVPAQMLCKEWVPRPLRRPLAWGARALLRLAERGCVVTLAEESYRHLFRREHAVFPNYPAAGSLPPLAGDAGYLVYVGDVTEERGALDMVEAVGAMRRPRPLRLVGRCPDALAERLRQRAAQLGVPLALTGLLAHRAAMEQAAAASAGLSLLRPLPNYLHSLPTKVVEYLEMGLPVVVSELPGTRAAVAGLAGVSLVGPADPAAAAAALDRILADGGARAGAATQARGLRERLVWPAAKVVALYREAAGLRADG
jgi:glycosyltransferase involved in cell wall biosynthesis